MSLKSSGAISTEDIARELGKEGQRISLNDEDVLKLAGKSLGQQVILPNDFYGKSFSSGGSSSGEPINIVTEKFVDFTDFKNRIGSILQKYNNNLSTVDIEFEDGGVSCTSPSKMFPTSLTHSPHKLILPRASSLKEAFSHCKLIWISEDILTGIKKGCSINYMFEFCETLTKIPMLKGIENLAFYGSPFYGVRVDVDFETAKFYLERKLEGIVSERLLCKFSPDNEEHIRVFQNLLNSKTTVKFIKPFMNNTMVKNTDFMMNMSNLSVINPENFFAESNLEYADLYVVKKILDGKESSKQMFGSCRSLKKFTNTRNVTKWFPDTIREPLEMFMKCEKLEYIDSDEVMRTLFNTVKIAKDFDRVFSGCVSYTGIIPECWNVLSPKYHTDYAEDCTKAKNYNSIPDNWK